MKLGQNELMGPIAVAAYSYMALVPIIQPPIMRLFTTEEERKIKMEQLRPVSKKEKILFPDYCDCGSMRIASVYNAAFRYVDVGKFIQRERCSQTADGDCVQCADVYCRDSAGRICWCNDKCRGISELGHY